METHKPGLNLQQTTDRFRMRAPRDVDEFNQVQWEIQQRTTTRQYRVELGGGATDILRKTGLEPQADPELPVDLTPVLSIPTGPWSRQTNP